MQKEYDALIKNGIWKLVNRLTNQHVLTTKQTLKRKRDIDGNIKKYKACWVASGFKQCKGIDYFKTFAAVVKPHTNKVLFARIAKNQLQSHQVDMIIAFINLRLDEKVYIEKPLYFQNKNQSYVLFCYKDLTD